MSPLERLIERRSGLMTRYYRLIGLLKTRLQLDYYQRLEQ